MTNNKQQTAVDKLETQIEKLRFQGVTEWQCGYQKALNEVLFLLKQAKEMEKERIENAWIAALDFGIEKMKGLNTLESKEAFDQFYNETYGGKNKK
jgi:hypothetical protein